MRLFILHYVQSHQRKLLNNLNKIECNPFLTSCLELLKILKNASKIYRFEMYNALIVIYSLKVYKTKLEASVTMLDCF